MIFSTDELETINVLTEIQEASAEADTVNIYRRNSFREYKNILKMLVRKPYKHFVSISLLWVFGQQYFSPEINDVPFGM